MDDHRLPTLIDLLAVGATPMVSGPQWSHESSDLDLTLLAWGHEQSISQHVNAEVDVVLIGVAGMGEVTVEDTVYRLVAGQALLIPKGAKRALRCSSEHWSYLSVHCRRHGLWPTVRGQGDA